MGEWDRTYSKYFYGFCISPFSFWFEVKKKAIHCAVCEAKCIFFLFIGLPSANEIYRLDQVVNKNALKNYSDFEPGHKNVFMV